jgi:hypothetical protein
MSAPTHVEHVLTVLAVMTEALEGDGSTTTMPDVTPDEAARYVYGALDANGYTIIKNDYEPF